PEYTESVLTSSAGPTLAPWREWLQQSEIVGASCPAPQLVRVVVERFRHVDPALAGLRGLALDDRQCCRAGKAGELGGGSGIGNPQRNPPLPDQGEDPSVAPERLEPEHALLLHQPQPDAASSRMAIRSASSGIGPASTAVAFRKRKWQTIFSN